MELVTRLFCWVVGGKFCMENLCKDVKGKSRKIIENYEEFLKSLRNYCVTIMGIIENYEKSLEIMRNHRSSWGTHQPIHIANPTKISTIQFRIVSAQIQ